MKWLIAYLAVLYLVKEFVLLDATTPIRLVHDTLIPSNSPFVGIGGIIQVYHSGQWGTVCHGACDMRDAKVACRQLGYTSTVGYWYNGRGSGKVWLYDMQCTGSETSLSRCSHDGWGIVHSGCKGHTADVGVVCAGPTGATPNNIRFEPGTIVHNAVAGLVEVYHQGQWGTVCHGSWGMPDAKVACQQLGFTKAVGPLYDGRGTGKVWLNMGCRGCVTTWDFPKYIITVTRILLTWTSR